MPEMPEYSVSEVDVHTGDSHVQNAIDKSSSFLEL
jgi:hypothetical protein